MRTVSPLSASDTDRLRVSEFSYREVGETRTGRPSGYHRLHREKIVGQGESRFHSCSAAVMRWQVQLRGGFSVASDDDVIGEGSVALLGVGVGRLRVEAPVRVVYVMDEIHRRGFAYGTLPGHPESGEELFSVEFRADESVVLAISAFSRPQSTAAKLAGPLGRFGQRLATERYLRALNAV